MGKPKKRRGKGSKGVNKRKRKKRKRTDQMVLGYPLSLVLKEPECKAGDTFNCARCGDKHHLMDATADFPEANPGDVLMYTCVDRVYVGGVKGHWVLNLEDKLNPYYRMAFLLTDMVQIFLPVAVMATEEETKMRNKGLLSLGNEAISIKIPLKVARQVRYAVAKANSLLNELDFIETVDQPGIEAEKSERDDIERLDIWVPQLMVPETIEKE